MLISSLHSWDLTPAAAVALQRELAGRVCPAGELPRPLRLVAGVDVSTTATTAFAAVVVYDLEVSVGVEVATAAAPLTFPYVPGLLSFRELPVVLAACRSLTATPDLLLVDGQGLAHPRRLGIACHLGLWLGLPTVGCAKSRLCGHHDEVGALRGSWVALRDDDGREIGRVLRSRDRVRPLYVSPGYRIGLDAAVAAVLACGRGYRLPEPTRLAHIESNRLRRSSG